MEDPVAVVVVDDQDIAREALSTLVTATPGLRLVAVASSGEQALAELAALGVPALVVMDVRMPGIGGLEAARRIVTAHAGHRVVLVSTGAVQPPDGVGFLPKARLTGRALLAAAHS